MFTGIVEQQGEIIANIQGQSANRLVINASFAQLLAGESIAVNGVCLTVLPDFTHHLAFDISPETLKLTTLSALKKGEKVNLERAMMATTRFGGHYVTGHVDGTTNLLAVTFLDECIEMTLGNFTTLERKYLLPKGSITLNGVSLTINSVDKECIKVLLVPHTINNTNLGKLAVGAEINVEFDYFTRIIAHQLESVVKATIMAQM